MHGGVVQKEDVCDMPHIERYYTCIYTYANIIYFQLIYRIELTDFSIKRGRAIPKNE